MNRYGAILDFIGFQDAFEGLSRRYLAPIAMTLFPELAWPGDISHHYSFVVRYREGEDVDLAEHSDASVVSINICLGKRFTASGLKFQPYKPLLNFGTQETYETKVGGVIPLQLGQTLIHRGQHRHEALPLKTGERINLLFWLFAKNGDVRVAPYSLLERPTQKDIWTTLDSKQEKEDQKWDL